MTRLAKLAVLIYLVFISSNLTSLGQESPAERNPVVDSEIGDVASYEAFLALSSRKEADAAAAIKEIDKKWHPGSTTMLIETINFIRIKDSQSAVTEMIERKTGQDFGFQRLYPWHRWIWSQPYDPHPEYAKFKSDLYSRMDKTFPQYFRDTANATIRLDEIRWGGVKRDGIPPLKDLEMMSAEEASYLDDSDVVFGVEMNGEKRCYPKRILAWHEMYKDTIGGVSVCGVY